MKTYSDLYKNKKLKAWVDLSTYCNAACPQCHRTNPNGLGKADWLPLIQWSLKEFQIAFPKKTMNHIKEFQICGSWGDPCMNKDILEICKYIINNSNSYIILNTNGSMRDEFWWKLLGYTLQDRGTIYFDIDGINQEMHSLYRQKTNLKSILEHIKAFSQYGNFSVFTAVFKHNEDYLKDIYALVKDIRGFKEILFVPTDRGAHTDGFKFVKDDKIYTLDHSPKYGNNLNGFSFKIDEVL